MAAYGSAKHESQYENGFSGTDCHANMCTGEFGDSFIWLMMKHFTMAKLALEKYWQFGKLVKALKHVSGKKQHLNSPDTQTSVNTSQCTHTVLLFCLI